MIATTLALLLLSPVQDEAPAKIEKILKSNFPGSGPGAAVAVVKEGKLLHTAARGLSDVEKKIAITPDSVFDLASCSKQFTAMAIMILVERGKLAFSDDARKVLKELPEYDPKRPIRILDLLHMTAGLDDYLKLVKNFATDTNEDALKAVAARPLRFPTGTKYEYSNTAYNFLALIVQRVSGESYGEFLSSEIFKPLQMKSTVVLERPNQHIPDRVVGYARKKREWKVDLDDTPNLVGDGGVFSTVADLARWDRALREGKLVSEKTLQAAFTSGTLDSGRRTGYGFGWSMGGDKSERIVWHNGSWAGTSTFITRNLKSGVTVIVLSNLRDAYVDEVATQIAELFEPK